MNKFLNEIHSNQKKAQFSTAYIHAIASAAGLKTYEFKVDDESIDIGLSAKGDFGNIRNPQLGLQLKCTANIKIIDKMLKFNLKRKNYDDLREPELHVPKILVVALVEKDELNWINFDHEKKEVLLRTAAYWSSLSGMPFLPEDQENKIIDISLSNVFDVKTVIDILCKVGLSRKSVGEINNV